MADNVLAQVPRKRYPTLDEQMRSDIVNYLSRLKSDFVTSGERAGQGLGQVIDDGNYLEGVPRVVLGGLGALSAPVSAAVSPVLGPLLQPVGEAVDTYVGQPIEQATGYPADITNEVFLTTATAGMAPLLKPALKGTGNFLAKMGDAAEAGLNRVGYTARPQAGTFFSGGGPVKLADDEGLIAYHGSPHSFDKFNMDKIGTGEGAQAYGHGLYFAEAEDVAKTYRDMLSDQPQALPAIGWQQRIDWTEAQDAAYGLADKALEELQIDIAQGGSTRPNWSRVKDKVRQLAPSGKENEVLRELETMADKYGWKEFVNKNPGSMYQVKINVKPDELLDWDKPFDDQPKAVQNAIQTLWTQKGGTLEGRANPPFVAHSGGDKGESIHAAIATNYADSSANNAAAQNAATNALKSAGVKGIRYLDAGSRDGRGGTYNYVVFDDSLITILKKYGIPMTAGAGGAMMVSGEAMPPELAGQMGGGA